MGLSGIVAALDDEIGRLQRVRELLAGTNGSVAQKSTSFAFRTNQPKAPRKRRQLSAEAQARISAAQKKRWAAQKRAAK